VLFFFFSSRGRHTRSGRGTGVQDVSSSDLSPEGGQILQKTMHRLAERVCECECGCEGKGLGMWGDQEGIMGRGGVV